MGQEDRDPAALFHVTCDLVSGQTRSREGGGRVSCKLSLHPIFLAHALSAHRNLPLGSNQESQEARFPERSPELPVAHWHP